MSKNTKKSLRDLRIENRYTQRAISENLGIPFSTYVAYELGYRKPSLAAVSAAAKFYGVKMESIECGN